MKKILVLPLALLVAAFAWSQTLKQPREDARRVDAGLYASVDVPLGRALSLSGGLRGDVVVTRNEGGYFGDQDTDNAISNGKHRREKLVRERSQMIVIRDQGQDAEN